MQTHASARNTLVVLLGWRLKYLISPSAVNVSVGCSDEFRLGRWRSRSLGSTRALLSKRPA